MPREPPAPHPEGLPPVQPPVPGQTVPRVPRAGVDVPAHPL